MNDNAIYPKRALISVSDKSGIIDLAQSLSELNIEIISTGGTAKHLQEAGIQVTQVSELTNFPEIMNGRVKTLHPTIFAGLLGKRDTHAEAAKAHDIPWIDLLVCNLYPFAKTIKKPGVTFDEVIENIDIGGPSMLRAAAKNMAWTTVISDHNDYQFLIDELKAAQGISFATRKKFAIKAFAHTAAYDGLIQSYLSNSAFPERLSLNYTKVAQLRYGENPDQQAAVYQSMVEAPQGVLAATQLQGKALSYNNILDSDAALNCLYEFDAPACVVVKHNNPCGTAVDEDINQAFHRAWMADSKSAFGSIVVLNKKCTVEIAEFLHKVFIEVLIAPDYDTQALAILKKKSNLRVLLLKQHSKTTQQLIKSIDGGLLLQSASDTVIDSQHCQCVTKTEVSEQQKKDLDFAWRVVKHIKSNAILIADNLLSLGVGAGQVSRVDAVEIALKKAGNFDQAVLASDAFFPFRDSIDQIANYNIKAIIQPGGSIRDEEVIAACDEHGIAMLFTGTRCFKH
ncbi:MAG: bifunctional phosphoribosylaminoimidazolecarboxamide formyltransferase/IMP cyclohydrolase [Pseudomonadota bacterium]